MNAITLRSGKQLEVLKGVQAWDNELLVEDQGKEVDEERRDSDKNG